MRKIISRFFALVLVFWLCGGVSLAQSGTVHGVAVVITAPAVGASAGNGNTVAGYNIYRCPGTCTVTSGTFTKIDTSLDLTLGYLDPASDAALTAGSTFTYGATTVDSAGNESSVFTDAGAVVTIPTAGFPTNPTAPTGCNAKVQ